MLDCKKDMPKLIYKLTFCKQTIPDTIIADIKTTSKFKDRFSVDNKKSCPISDHFNLPGHSMSNMIFFAFEKVLKDDPFIIGARERFYIDKMEVIQHGINKNRTNK
jgi:hypothetical protein